ncbi:hypothetical protein [Paenibacillus alginolyticus]|uniref:Polymer-forming cytoskeletal protein n=1 Tax=Paenibacillus alginolyticus TaxID=59839 RepID=A0ABT4G5M1_9BACL|nr:hypothetical protein [Paenibacillus alginolyticus]MCY9691476.1 hypothetical protein [Paenibacillus alginolyticus]MEC0146586.1 hypothetical protein [Paenibacillus alginolyticus]
MKQKSIIFIALMFCALMFTMPTNAMAKGIFEHQDTVVPENQVVDDVVVVGADATIWGTVKDSVIVFNGNVNLKASAKIKGFVLVIGGNIQQEQGAVVTDEIINLSFDKATQNSLLIGGGLVIGTWLLQLTASIMLIILPVLATLILKQRMQPFIERARLAPGRLLFIGFFSSIILIALSVLLFVTIIGIPIAIIILVLVLLSFIIGMSALSILVGERIQGTFGRSNWFISLTGSILLVSLMNIPLVGVILFFGILLFSIGIMTLWILEKTKRKSSVKL